MVIILVNFADLTGLKNNEYRFETIGSTNTYAKELAEKGASEWDVVISQSQTAGRGRLGRQFYSPNLSGIYFSIILRPETDVRNLPLITVAAAVSVSDAIDKIFNVKTGIKWVNDIFLDGKKICGILTEGSFSAEQNSIDYAILGIGINLYAPKDSFPDEIKNIAGYICKDPVDSETKDKLIYTVMTNFKAFYNNLESRSFIDEYRKKSVILGKDIYYLVNGEKVYAKALEIDDNAGLIVKNKSGGICHINAGEVSVKL